MSYLEHQQRDEQHVKTLEIFHCIYFFCDLCMFSNALMHMKLTVIKKTVLYECDKHALSMTKYVKTKKDK